MKRSLIFAFMLALLLASAPLQAQIAKPIYVSLPGPGNVQHLAYAVKERPNFKPEQFVDDRFYKNALKTLAKESGAKS